MAPEKTVITANDIKGNISNRLRTVGYQVTENTPVHGKSGIEHTFDMLGRSDDGIAKSTIAVKIAVNYSDSEADIIFNFANKAYDAGILERLLVASPDFGTESKKFARQFRIKVLDARELFSAPLLEIKIDVTKQPPKLETRQQFVAYLTERGYRVEENAKITGRSGVNYNFDILAYFGSDLFSRTVAIDFFNATTDISVEQVSNFDAKAYDTGVDYKVMVVNPRLVPGASQLAEQQRIKVFELNAIKEDIAIGDEAKKILQNLVSRPKPSVKLSPQPEALQIIPEVVARRYNILPLSLSANNLEVAMANPNDIFAMEAISALSRKRVKPVAADAKDLRDAIDFNYKGYSEIEKQISTIHGDQQISDDKVAIDLAGTTPLVQALNMIIDEAAKARASDIHFEPEENRLRIRYRIDGTLHDMMSLPLNIHKPLISRLKILSELNIADSHRPQDGQFTITAKDRQLDVRVATAPTVNGEMAVLRLLDKTMAVMSLSDLGFLPESLAKYENLLRVPYGMIMIIGPTGSGKTTTLYASLNTIDAGKNNIITIEDPAEYHLKDINQIQVNPQAGLTFATGLRSILRLDPNVIMVGEVRDGETAGIAVQSALTGHLMLCSMHANDTTSALSRLIDLGVEPFLAASSVIGVISQRMVRRLCPDCQRTMEVPALEQTVYEQATGEKRGKFPYGTGCKTCSYTGYRGRIGVYEVLVLSDAIKLMVAAKESSTAMRVQALKEGMITMMNAGMQKVKMGITTPSDVLRAAYTSNL